jgi:hypothetical protein
MEAVRYSESLVSFNLTAQRTFPEDSHLHTYHCEYMKPLKTTLYHSPGGRRYVVHVHVDVVRLCL